MAQQQVQGVTWPVPVPKPASPVYALAASAVTLTDVSRGACTVHGGLWGGCGGGSQPAGVLLHSFTCHTSHNPHGVGALKCQTDWKRRTGFTQKKS